MLAVGGHGEVYRGVDEVTGIPIVLKRLRPELITRAPEYVIRFQREGEALRRLNHPNIVKMLNIFEEEGQYCIIMEYVPGGSLRDHLDQKKSLPANEVLAIGLELADALGRAHHLGIIHRDLKPENVLLAADGTPRLTDFGVARLESSDMRLTQTGSILGSPAYMSPEALQGQELEASSDVWSLGVLLYEMLAGERPFKGEQITAIMLSILNDVMPEITQFQPDVPPPLADLLRRMLAKERARRPASARLVAAELEAIRTGKWEVGPDKQISSSRLHHFLQMPAAPPAPQQHGLEREEMFTPSAAELSALSHPFIGREKELTDLKVQLTQPNARLLTVTGPGGIGKTRVVLALIRQMQVNFTGGIVFVPLAPLQSADHLVSALVNALNLHFEGSGDPRTQVLQFLQPRQMLLVLDNFEHLLEGVELVKELLIAAPKVKILATSRERLNLSGEILFPLSGLSFPELATGSTTPIGSAVADYDAVKLLVEQARRVRPGLQLDAPDYRCLARICCLVGGMPLALVLAAGWLEILSLAEVEEEISNSLDFLESELRDLPERHRSIRAILEASWQQLTPDTQQVFARLSVFRGGFMREAAQQIAGAGLHTLRRFVNHSLLTITDMGRYEVHELLRQYADEKLQTMPDLHTQTKAAHAHYYLNLVETNSKHLKSSDRATSLTVFSAEFANIRAAWQWTAARQDIQAIARFALPLSNIFEKQAEEGVMIFRQMAAGLDETNPAHHAALGAVLVAQAEQLMRLGHDPAQPMILAERALELLQHIETPQVTLKAISLLGNAFWLQGDYQKAKSVLEEGLAFLYTHGAPDEIGDFVIRLGLIEREIHSEQEVMAFYQKSLEELRALDDPVSLAHQLLIYGEYLVVNGRARQGQRFLEESLALASTAGSTDFYPFILMHLGFTAYKLGDYADAESYLREGLAVAQAEARIHPAALAHIFLGRVKVARNAFMEAEQHLTEGLQLGRTHKLTLVLTLALVSFAEFYVAQHEFERAVSLLTVVLQHPATEKRDRQDAEQQLQALQSNMPVDKFEQTVARSKRLSLEEIVEQI